MKLISRNGIGVVLVELQGTLDSRTAPELENGLKPLLTVPAPRLIIDFDAVDYVSSAAIRVLLTALKTARQKQGEIRFTGVFRSVKQIFDIAGLSQHVATFSSRAQALANFGLEVTELKDRAVPIFRLEGNLDKNAAPLLKQWLDTSFAATLSLVLDFTRVNYAAIECLRALQTFAGQTTTARGTLILLGVQPAVMESIEVSGLKSGSLKFASSIEGAIALLSPESP